MTLPKIIDSHHHITPINISTESSNQNKPLVTNINNVANSPDLIPARLPSVIPSLRQKLDIYREYARRGSNPEDAREALRILHLNISDIVFKENKYSQDIIEIIPALTCLANEFLTLDIWEKMTNNQQNAINKRETIARELIHAFTLFPEILINLSTKKQLYLRAQHRKVLTEELVSGALQMLLTGEESEAERDAQSGKIRELIETPPHAMAIPLRERLWYFFSLGHARLQAPADKKFAELKRQLKRTIKNARRFLSSGQYNLPPASTDFQHSIRLCHERLEKLMTGLEQDISGKCVSQTQIASSLTEKWLSHDGIRISIPARKLAKSAADTAHQAANFFDYTRPFNKPRPSIPLQSLIQFNQASKETRQVCLTLKVMSIPATKMAAELLAAAMQLAMSVKVAKDAGIRDVPGNKTPEQALLTALLILTEDTPQTRLVLAIQTAQSIVQWIKTLSPPEAGSSIEKAFAAHIRQVNADLADAASGLSTVIQRAMSNLLQQTISDCLSQVVRTTGNIHEELNNALELATGVSLRSSREWLNKQLNIFTAANNAITRVTTKGDTRFPTRSHTAMQQLENETRLREVHLSILPVLNEVEKIRVTGDMLETALREVRKKNNSEYQALNSAIEKCAGINQDVIRKSVTLAIEVLRGNDIPVYQRGDEYPGHSITLGKVLARLSVELLEASGQLQATAEQAIWSMEEKAESINMVLARIKKRLSAIKRDIKDAVQSATGTRLHNNSRQGMMAKDAGEWLAALRKEWCKNISPQETDNRTEELIQCLSTALATEEDPGGQVFRKRTHLALEDAEGGGIPWPATALAILGATKSKTDYIQAWAEKRLTYGTLYNLLIHSSPMAMFSLHKSTLFPPLRLMNLALTPIRIEMTQREMEKVRPGKPQPVALIKEYKSREKYQAAVRFMSMLSPQLPKTLAAIGIAATGIKVEDEYREHFIKRAISRLPGDLLWIGGFATG